MCYMKYGRYLNIELSFVLDPPQNLNPENLHEPKNKMQVLLDKFVEALHRDEELEV